MVAVLVGIFAAAYLETKTKIEVQVPKADLSAYYQIRQSDLTSKVFASNNVPSNALKKSQQIVGHYTLTNISKEKPLTKKQLTDPNHLADTVAVGIPATPSMTFGGNLEAGDIVDITLVPVKSQVNSQKNYLASPILFSRILVLGVKSAPQANTSIASVILIALPRKSQSDFATYMPGATLVVSRKL
ncbi:hypothetical protein [Nostoc sp. ChiVER01]|uniref:hypothetical protein n=1 Tax=Nostoc sp. ChiVER01 TaxID=3075382 RepID=UPI002AD252FC|nr:hypothetical protein [Nostoc sp. ChiVER01]MDZ8226729.1 hypothetical protein [Nostoc sp. ChiVER01]